MTETQKSFPDAFKFAFGFGNVYVSMRYGEELPKEDFFVGLNGTCSVEVKDNNVFSDKFSGYDTIKKLRPAIMPIIEKVGTRIIRKYAETDKIYFSDIRSYTNDIGKAFFSDLCENAEIALLGVSIKDINVDGIVARRAADPVTYTLCNPIRLSPTIRLVMTGLLCGVLMTGVIFVLDKLSLRNSQSESSYETVGTNPTVTTSFVDTTPSNTTSSTTVKTTSVTKATTAESTTTITQTTELVETTPKPDKEHFDGEKFEYDDMTVRIENGKCVIEKYNGSATEVYIPDEIDSYVVYRLDEGAFFSCVSLEKVRLPEKLTEIGQSAFHYCTFLKEIIIPDGVKSIMHSAFAYCSSLKEVVVPDSVVEMGNCVFMNCTSLKRAILGGNYNDFDNIFLYCSNLSYVELPDGIKLMDGFRDCESMEEIHIPSSVKLIRGGAFSGCTKLARVYLSDKMIIEKDAFRGCEFITFYLYADKIPDGYGDGLMPPNSVVLLAKEAK